MVKERTTIQNHQKEIELKKGEITMIKDEVQEIREELRLTSENESEYLKY
jgi:hypothetical protein